ncbi:hypothetical protein BBJ28_00000422 [Nothophytophthora sp. Chile5]|nr:hypothetical protein BBJ28_00000422 [Nothophytophthora sp. Chile5]
MENPSIDAERVYTSVKDYYGKQLQQTSDLQTSACCTLTAPPARILQLLRNVPDAVVNKYYGCGTPIPFGIEGCNVLDLGCGSGRDAYVAAVLVGPDGTVTGVDMTDEQLQVARDHVDQYTTTQLGYSRPNLHFVEGYIECLEKAGLAPGSMDVVISNCVVNLSPQKEQVLREVHRVLREGGEFYFSDVYASRRLPAEAQNHEVLRGECIGGALYVEDFKRLCRKVGFGEPRQLSSSPVGIQNQELAALIGLAQFTSITYRCFKVSGLEEGCREEDYGQVATYLGTITEHPHAYTLDEKHVFEKGRPIRVGGNTAAILSESWLSEHFRVMGDRSVHFGPLESKCSGATAAATRASPARGAVDCC